MAITLADAIVRILPDDLVQRPYSEVYQLIAALQQLQPAPEAPSEPAAKGK